MSIISQVKWFFAQTISGSGEIMHEPDADWHMVAKKIMYDFRAFNSEIFDLPSDSEDMNKENIEPSQGKSNVLSLGEK